MEGKSERFPISPKAMPLPEIEVELGHGRIGHGGQRMKRPFSPGLG
jgi:hypothetical protein